MPTVPRRTTALQPTPGSGFSSSANPDAFGAGIGEQVQRLASQGLQAVDAIDRRQTEDAARVARERYALASDAFRSTAIDLRLRSGSEARGATAEAQDRLQEVYSEHTKGLDDKALRQFSTFWQSYTGPQLSAVEQHEKTQLMKADDSRAVAILDGSVSDVGATPTSPEVVQQAEAVARASLATRAKINGWTAEELQLEEVRQLSRMHGAGVEALLSHDMPDQAGAYLERHGEKLDPRIRQELGERVQDHSRLKQAQEIATLSLATSMGESEALRLVREGKNPATGERLEGRLQEEVADQIRIRGREQAAATREREEAQYRSALGAVLEASTPSEALQIAKTWSLPAERRLELLKTVSGLANLQGAKENADNVVGQYKVLEAVDEGQLSSPEEVQAAVLAIGGTRSQVKEAVDYLQQGGLSGRLSVSTLAATARRFDKDITGEELSRLKSLIVRDLKLGAPGKEVTQEVLDTKVAGYMARGEYDDGGSVFAPWTWGDPNATAFKAAQLGTLGTWAPDVDKKEAPQLQAQMLELGIPEGSITPEAIQLFKKDRVLGLPLSPAEVRRAEWRKAPRRQVSDQAIKQQQAAADVLGVLRALKEAR